MPARRTEPGQPLDLPTGKVSIEYSKLHPQTNAEIEAIVTRALQREVGGRPGGTGRK